MSNEILRWFDSTHLPSAQTRITVEVFASTARHVIDETAPGEEQDAALRALLVAKDAAVRAQLIADERAAQPLLDVPPACPHVHWDEMISGGSRVRRCRDCHETFGWDS